MSTPQIQALVPITLGGWRVWDLYAAHELYVQDLTRGIHVGIDRAGVVVPETERQVTASELEMILGLFGDQALAFHIATHADENRIPGFLEKLIGRYPALSGATFQLNNQLRPNTCEALLPVKKKHNLKIILPHFNLFGADAWAASVSVADQVLFDAGGLRNQQALSIDERALSAISLVTDICKAPISFAGRLTDVTVADLGLKIHEVRPIINRPLALAGDTHLKPDGSLNLVKTAKFYEACAQVLGITPTPAA